MKIDVRKQWRYNSTLWGASVTDPKNSILLDACLEKTFDVTQDAFVCYAMSQKFHQLVLVNSIEETSYIGFYNIFCPSTFNGLVQHSQGIVATPFRAKSVRVVYEILLIDALEDSAQSGLHQFVLKGGNTQWPHFTTSGFRDVDPQHRLWDVRHPMESLDKIIKVCHQILCICIFGNLVNATGFTRFQLPEAFPQKFLIHQMKQTGELTRWIFAGFLCYALQFRCYTLIITGHDVYFPLALLLLQWPFLFRHYPAS